MSALIDGTDRPAELSSDTTLDDEVADTTSAATSGDTGGDDEATPHGHADDDTVFASPGSDGVTSESAFSDGEADGIVDDVAPGSSGAQVVQDGPAPTRAQLRTDFGAHLEANYPRLVAQLYAITLDPAEAHSAVQDAYSRAWRSWATVSRTPDPTGWVRRVAVRSTIRSWRRFRWRSRRPVGPGTETNVGALLAALRRLPPPERRCVVLHHMAGAPLSEIAAVEGISVGTTAARLSRAQQVVNAGLVDMLSDVGGPDEHSVLNGWAAPEWNSPGLSAAGAVDDDEERP